MPVIDGSPPEPWRWGFGGNATKCLSCLRHPLAENCTALVRFRGNAPWRGVSIGISSLIGTWHSLCNRSAIALRAASLALLRGCLGAEEECIRYWPANAGSMPGARPRPTFPQSRRLPERSACHASWNCLLGAGQQVWLNIEVPEETRVQDAIERSGILKQFPPHRPWAPRRSAFSAGWSSWMRP